MASSFVGAISMALNSLTSDFAEHGDHLAHDLSMRAIDRGVGGIVRNEPDMAMILAERFHRGFIVEQRRHNISIFRGVLLAYHHKITIADSRVNHGVAMYFKHKQIAGASETFRQTHHIVHMLLGGDGHAWPRYVPPRGHRGKP